MFVIIKKGFDTACNGESCSFTVNNEYPRSPTFDWISDNVQNSVLVTVDDQTFTINPASNGECSSDSTTSSTCLKCENGTIISEKNDIVNLVIYENADNELGYFQVKMQTL
jgi:hypothetical protein